MVCMHVCSFASRVGMSSTASTCWSTRTTGERGGCTPPKVTNHCKGAVMVRDSNESSMHYALRYKIRIVLFLISIAHRYADNVVITAATTATAAVGYKELFVDEDATCVVSGNMSLKTAQCVNVCYRKVKQSKAGAGPDLLKRFLSLFNRQ